MDFYDNQIMEWTLRLAYCHFYMLQHFDNCWLVQLAWSNLREPHERMLKATKGHDRTTLDT